MEKWLGEEAVAAQVERPEFKSQNLPKPDSVVYICNLSTPTARQEAETEALDAHGPAHTTCAQVKGTCLKQNEREG